MVKTKKLFAVVMALVMLASCFVVSASALSYAPTNTTGEFKVVASADNTTVKAGDVVTITMSVDPGSITDLGAFQMVIVYNGNQLTPVGTGSAFRTWKGEAANFANPNATVNLNLAVTGLASAFTADEKAYYTKGIMISGATHLGSTARWNPPAGDPVVSFQMKVSDSVQPGDEIWLGNHNAAYTRNMSFFAQGTTRLAAAKMDLTNSMVKLTVGSSTVETTPLEISAWKNQIRFDKNSKDEFAGTFDARMLMSIDNFDEVFGDVAGAQDAVIDVGYLFNKGAAIDVDAAMAQVESGSGSYSQVKDIYVSTAFKAEKAYVMSCMIQNIPEADKGVTLSAMAYVVYTDANGETAYAYSPVVTSTFEKLYEDNYSNAFPNG